MGSSAGLHPVKQKDLISWFEIPVYDIHRATAFYNTIFHIEMEAAVNGEFAMAYFPSAGGIGGALIYGPGCVPNDTGTLIYLNAGADIDGVLGRIDRAGGRVIMSRTLISEDAGHFALFIDSEGNRVALHEGPRRGEPTTKTSGAAAKKAAIRKKAATPKKKRAPAKAAPARKKR